MRLAGRKGFSLLELLMYIGFPLVALALVYQMVAFHKKVKFRTEGSDELSISARALQNRLERVLLHTGEDGVHVSSSNRVVLMQPQTEVLPNGNEVFSDKMRAFWYDSVNRRVGELEINLADLSLTHDPYAPVILSASDIDQIAGTLPARTPSFHISNVDVFNVEEDKAEITVDLQMKESRGGESLATKLYLESIPEREI